MSLLGSGARYEPCTVYLEEVGADIDGNIKTKPSLTGTPATARFQIQTESGTSRRRSEEDNEGFESETIYMIRFPSSFPYTLGKQSQIVWNGRRWAVFGDPFLYNSSRRTSHQVYTIKSY